MKQKKIPQRKCIACNERSDKKALVRIVKNKDGEIFFDPTLKANGRGAYICHNVDCLKDAIRKKAIERALGEKLSDDIIVELTNQISSN